MKNVGHCRNFWHWETLKYKFLQMHAFYHFLVSRNLPLNFEYFFQLCLSTKVMLATRSTLAYRLDNKGLEFSFFVLMFRKMLQVFSKPPHSSYIFYSYQLQAIKVLLLSFLSKTISDLSKKDRANYHNLCDIWIFPLGELVDLFLKISLASGWDLEAHWLWDFWTFMLSVNSKWCLATMTLATQLSVIQPGSCNITL